MTNEELKKELNSEILNDLSTEVNPKKDILDLVIDLVKTGVVVFVVAFLLRYFVIQPFLVDGQSMMPNYHHKEYILTEKLSYMTGEPRRGDVIVFRYPRNPSVSYIKRVIGLPGETVRIANNKITIVNSTNPSGMVLTEDYIPADFKTKTYDNGDSKSAFEKTLQEKEYFVMGDNREHSSDSREWGVLPKTLITGRAWLTLMPLDRIKIHERITYKTSISYISNRLSLLASNSTK
ncbi:MAG: signal peptidase I [Patescibacteria group bacterium]|jgi:signal peptidase I